MDISLVALHNWYLSLHWRTAYPKKYAHGFCFAVLCCGYTLTDFPISIRLTSLALWQSNDCPSASKATLMNMDKYFMWIHYERLHNHNKARHNKTMCIFLGICCSMSFIASQITGNSFVVEKTIQAIHKENKKGPHYWPLAGKSTTAADGFPSQKLERRKAFAIHDVSMLLNTNCCIIWDISKPSRYLWISQNIIFSITEYCDLHIKALQRYRTPAVPTCRAPCAQLYMAKDKRHLPWCQSVLSWLYMVLAFNVHLYFRWWMI